MSVSDPDRLPAELDGVARRLREQKPVPDALKLDSMKLNAKSRASHREPALVSLRKGTLLTSRLLITSLLTLGIFVSGTGGALALSGISSQGNVSAAQYVEGQTESGGNDQGGRDPNAIGVAPVSAAGSSPRGEQGGQSDEKVQRARQESASGGGGNGDSLPFTGFAAMPLLLAGVMMMAGGLLLRRRASA